MIERLVRGSLRVLLYGLITGLGGVRVRGRENVPSSGAVLIAPNHVSHLDPILIGMVVKRPVWFLATDELFDIPILGPLSRYLRAFPIRQDSPDRRALRRAEALLTSGEALVVFPEGHESLDGQLQPLQGGIILLAMRTGAPVVPVGIVGSSRILPPREWRPRHGGGPVHIRFGPSIPATELTGGFSGKQAIQTGLARLEAELRRLTGQWPDHSPRPAMRDDQATTGPQ